MSKMMLLFTALSLITGIFSKSSLAEEGSITGIYVGSMHLVDGTERDIPLAFSLALTDETTSTPTGTQYIIDGSCVIDEEGGPYTFTRVYYDLDNNRLDMKYSRPRGDPTTVAPASFRLVGSLGNDNTISGTVTSGMYGPIGTFKVTRDGAIKSLPIRNKYAGRWDGIGRNVKFKYDAQTSIVLQASTGHSIVNPSDYEFDFTPGHTGGYTFDNTLIGVFNQITIDYLRRKVNMVDSSGAISLNLVPDFANGKLSGQQTSTSWGLTAVFEKLTRIE